MGFRASQGGEHRAEDPSGFVDAFAFVRQAEQLIAYRRSSWGATTPYNVGSARVLGAELLAGAVGWDALRSQLSLTALDPRDTSQPRGPGNDILPLRSLLVVSFHTEAYVRPSATVRGLDRISTGMRISHRGSRYADDAGLEVIPHHNVVDLELSAHLWEGTLAVRGVLNNAFAVHSFDVVGLPQPGRRVHATLEASWW